MKTVFLALAVLVPALASADDAKSVVFRDGHAVSGASNAAGGGTPAAKTTSAFGTSAIRPGISTGRPASAASGARTGGARASARRGILGGAPAGGTGAGAGGSAAPAVATEQGGWATPGAKILTAGQQPVYSTPAGGGTNSVDGGGFIVLDEGRAHDVARAPSVYWAPPDTPPSTRGSGAGGNGATTNGPALSVDGPPAAPLTSPNKSNGATGGTGFNAAF